MSTLAVVPSAPTGIEVVAAAAGCAAGGDIFPNTGRELAIFTNASGSPINVTIVTPGTLDAHAIADRVVAVGANSTKAIGPLKPGTYNNPTGYVSMTYSTNTGLSVSILQVNP